MAARGASILKALLHTIGRFARIGSPGVKGFRRKELLKTRTGGVRGILKTLFHIVYVEYSWIRVLKGKSEFDEPFEAYAGLGQVRDLSARFHAEVEPYVLSWTPEMECRVLELPRPNGEPVSHGLLLDHR